MTDCSSIHGSTSSSSDVLSSRGGGGVMSPRIRIVRLLRPNSKRVLLGPESNATFGFAVRGGKEFGSGFFVSRIDKGSEADAKGLRIGDQIIRANGYHVEDAVHKEFAQFISSQDRITLKVRGVGMLPIKEKAADSLTWHIVPHHALTSITDLEDIPPSKDVRIVLKVAPRTKLGLGICKGPEWKPGIYVQFTKDFSVARDAGLRPGDQILSCNSIDFSDVLFSEAVAVMKGSHTLEMIIRPGAGLDLFPGESSGYNSSASSVTGDQSPCWGDQSAKRLSIVREENSLPHQRVCPERNNLDRRKEGPAVNSIYEEIAMPKPDNRTIIQLSGTGMVISNPLNTKSNNLQSQICPTNGLSNQNTTSNVGNNSFMTGGGGNVSSSDAANCGNAKETYATTANDIKCSHQSGPSVASPETSNQTGGKIADICFVSRQSETKTVIVEVHRSAAEDGKALISSTAVAETADGTKIASASVNGPAPPSPPKPPPAFPTLSHDTLDRCPSVASCTLSACSLSSAISEELKKRQVRRTVSHDPNQPNGTDTLKSQPKRIGNPSVGGVTNADEKQHHALMDEFKRAHRKMFKNGFQETEKDSTEERQDELNKAVVMRDEVDRGANLQQETKNITSPSAFPTPPPPPEFANGYKEKPQTNGDTATIRRQFIKQKPIDEAPCTPAPDYDDSTPTNTLTKSNGISTIQKEPTYANANFNATTLRRVAAASEVEKANGDAAEMESIESFKLKNSASSSTNLRPPSLYFAPPNSGPPTMKKITRPVSVTIGEYGVLNGARKEPSKFDFIAKSADSTPTSGSTASSRGEDNVSELLRSELEKTLSRSNLKKANEARNMSAGNLNNGNENGGEPNSTPNNNDKPLCIQKIQATNVQRLANILQNRQQNGVDVNCNGSDGNANVAALNKTTLRKVESSPPVSNGILKNGLGKESNKSFGEKNITFGN